MARWGKEARREAQANEGEGNACRGLGTAGCNGCDGGTVVVANNISTSGLLVSGFGCQLLCGVRRRVGGGGGEELYRSFYQARAQLAVACRRHGFPVDLGRGPLRRRAHTTKLSRGSTPPPLVFPFSSDFLLRRLQSTRICQREFVFFFWFLETTCRDYSLCARNVSAPKPPKPYTRALRLQIELLLTGLVRGAEAL